MTESATIAVVQGQIDAYNARDLDRIVTYYAPDGVVRDAAEGRFNARGLSDESRQSVILHILQKHLLQGSKAVYTYIFAETS